MHNQFSALHGLSTALSEPTMSDLRFYVINAQSHAFLAAVTKQDSPSGLGYAVPEWTTDHAKRLESPSQDFMIRLQEFIGPSCRVESTPKVVLIA